MEIGHCQFPDGLLYDTANHTWASLSNEEEVTVGITSLLTNMVGRMISFRPKRIGSRMVRNSSLATLESQKFVGPVPSPFSGQIMATNESLIQNPKILNDSPYTEAWIARIRPDSLEDEASLLSTFHDAEASFRQEIIDRRVRCFKLYPDLDLFEIGLECSAVLVKLNEALSQMPAGGVVHVVSDEPTALVEMIRWTEDTGYSLVEWRAEGNLTHFIVRKARG